jgi:hypothetical protein
MKNLIKRSTLGAALVVASSAALAAVYYNNVATWDGNTYVTLYSKGTEYAKVDIKNNQNRNALLSWKTNAGAGNDYAAGVGWANVAKPKNLYYSIDDWKAWATGDGVVFGAYGWSCNDPGQNNVEFYITEAWFGGGQFVPGSTSKKGFVDTNHGRYDIYVGGALNRDQRCTNGRSFQQVWAVRQGARSVGKTNVTLEFTTIVNKMDDYAFFKNTYSYLVMGIDGFPGSSGDVTLKEVQKD